MWAQRRTASVGIPEHTYSNTPYIYKSPKATGTVCAHQTQQSVWGCVYWEDNSIWNRNTAGRAKHPTGCSHQSAVLVCWRPLKQVFSVFHAVWNDKTFVAQATEFIKGCYLCSKHFVSYLISTQICVDKLAWTSFIVHLFSTGSALLCEMAISLLKQELNTSEQRNRWKWTKIINCGQM